MPSLNVRVSPARTILPLAAAGERRARVSVRVDSLLPRAARARVSLDAPQGWTVEPREQATIFARENERRMLEFRVAPPAGALVSGSYALQAIARLEGAEDAELRSGYREIAYHHIETRHLYEPAMATVDLIDVRIAPDLSVGYVMGVGDEVPRAITALGARVQLLERRDLETGDLSPFDVIVTGVRAYKDRDDLAASNHRLLEYVREGGVVLVQYNKYEFLRAEYGPYPVTIARPHDRVTDENAPVNVLAPSSPVFTNPNVIGPSDWDGWVQERGLYFLGTWDERYRPLLEMEDSFPYNKGKKRGSLVMAKYGSGVWVYTGIGFFRQLPAGVPGAYRLFANLLSLAAR